MLRVGHRTLTLLAGHDYRRSGSTFSEAEYAGPWTVRQPEDCFAVLREADGDAGAPEAVFTERETALLIAAVYPTMGREQRFQITTAEGAAGADVNASSAASSRRPLAAAHAP